MLVLRQCLLLSTLLLGAISSPTPPDQPQQELGQQPCSSADKTAFQKLLASVDESSLHSALHLWSSRFKDGVFNRDSHALEAVHSENAPIATSLVNIAKRQQNGSGGNNTQTPSQSRTPTPSPTPSPSPSRSASPPPASRTASPSATPSAEPTVTSARATRAASTIAVPETTPASATAIATSNDEVVFSVSGESELSTVDATSEVVSFVPTSSTVVFITTLPDGGQSTLTSVTVVDAPVTGGGIGAPDAGATGGSGGPSLQDGAASATRGIWREVVAVVGGAVVWGMYM